jgi:hypothetical protein
MTTGQRIKQRWTGRSHTGEATTNEDIMEEVRDILSSRDEIAIRKLKQIIRVLRTAARLRAEGYRPRFNYGQNGLLRAVVVDGKGKNP